jgi:hypothetical protein
MTNCEWLSDRMPTVARGHAEWTPEEARHIGECRICGQEWGIVRAAGRLGASVEGTFDRDATANEVLQRLRTGRQAEHLRRRTWGLAGLAAAAAVALAVWSGRIERTVEPTPEPGSLAAGQFAFPLPELEYLQPAELDSVLQTMDEPNLIGSAVEDPDLGDLNSDQLERVLDSWEG